MTLERVHAGQGPQWGTGMLGGRALGPTTALTTAAPFSPALSAEFPQATSSEQDRLTLKTPLAKSIDL